MRWKNSKGLLWERIITLLNILRTSERKSCSRIYSNAPTLRIGKGRILLEVVTFKNTASLAGRSFGGKASEVQGFSPLLLKT